jgi:hypothetical protein
MASSVTLALTVSGQVGKAPLEPTTQTFALSGMTAAVGPQAVKVPAAAAAATIDVCVVPMTTQRLLLIQTDEEVTYQINTDGINRVIEKGGFAVHPGDPVVTALAFGGNGQTDAEVTVYQLGLA